MRYLALTAALCSAAALAQEPADLTYRGPFRSSLPPPGLQGTQTLERAAQEQPDGARPDTGRMGAGAGRPLGSRTPPDRQSATAAPIDPYTGRPLQPGMERGSPQ